MGCPIPGSAHAPVFVAVTTSETAKLRVSETGYLSPPCAGGICMWLQAPVLDLRAAEKMASLLHQENTLF